MSFSLYFHIPFCQKKCDYCDFYSVECRTIETSQIKKLTGLMLDELSARLDIIQPECIDSIFIGGGTPSSLPDKILENLLSGIIQRTHGLISDDCEFTTEANPESCTESFLNISSGYGVNRLSLGVQSFDEMILKHIGRGVYPEEVFAKVEQIRSLWKGRLSLDLISGTGYDILPDLEKAVLIEPDHLSVYSLTIEDETPLSDRELENDFIPADEDTQIDSMKQTFDFLNAKEFKRYEISNYCKPGMESVHNCAYWRMQSYEGIGPGAFSSAYESIKAFRRANPADINKYLECKNTEDLLNLSETEIIDGTDYIFEHYMMGYRMDSGPDRKVFKSRFGIQPHLLVPKTLTRWRNYGYKIDKEGRIDFDLSCKLNSFLADIYSELEESTFLKKK